VHPAVGSAHQWGRDGPHPAATRAHEEVGTGPRFSRYRDAEAVGELRELAVRQRNSN
jgi:hypothetical protein